MIGQTVWVFDPNRRVYRKNAAGCGFGAPVYREHFRPIVISGETSRSWTVGDGRWQIKIPKAGGAVRGNIFMTEAAVNDDVWIKEHKYRIESLVGRLTDVETLRKVAALIGYEDGESA